MAQSLGLGLGLTDVSTSRSALSIAKQLAAAVGGAANLAATLLYGVNATVSVGALASWADANGNGATITQATASLRPTDTGSSYLFDGVDDFLLGAYVLAQPFTRFLVLNPVTWTNGKYFYDGGTNDSTVLQQFTSTPNTVMVAGAAGPQRNVPLGAFAVHTAQFNGASSLAEVNNNGTVTANAGANGAGGLALGARANGLFASNIGVKAVVDVLGAISGAQRLAVKNVLYAAYGIAP